MPYCNQAPHTIFKIKCEELYFKEMWKHKISWKWCISFAFIWCWEIMCQNLNWFEWIQWYYWHENQMLTYLNESNSINESNNIKGCPRERVLTNQIRANCPNLKLAYVIWRDRGWLGHAVETWEECVDRPLRSLENSMEVKAVKRRQGTHKIFANWHDRSLILS